MSFSLVRKICGHSQTWRQIEGTFVRHLSLSSLAAMRFIQYRKGKEDTTRLGVLSEDGKKITSLSSYGNDMIEFLKKDVDLGEISKKVSGLPSEEMTGDVTLLSPVSNPEKIVCIGLNYRGHCEEQNLTPPVRPMFFSKFASTLVGPTGSVIAHEISTQIDWEVELAVVIGKTAKKVPREKAYDYVFGYCVAQDISARDWQKVLNNKQFLIGKSMDTFCPLGPAIVHKSLVPDPHNLKIRCSINGVQKQSGNTNELIFRIDDIINRLTQSITLRPGDVILTGTPGGVGMFRDPPEYLKPGDVIDSEIEILGKMTNPIIKDE
ncbi:fumarylacetoacetate hydrolase domain-containing protein 2 [Phlebotomus papatasi]|uniref:fumarylacetoacetate hydrolase domain-containing protein 2 n=1 Tax=Phlebotomus papatasi TaxID=29031 RepID=UPI00248416A1|nr:fumarylacetoacetate hydrolase domain-containing protein 2 [Phlebotomus papatasi]